MTKFEQLVRALSDELLPWQQERARDLAWIAINTLRDPTDEMWAAGLRIEYAHKDSTDTATKAIWQAMIDEVMRS